VTRTRARHERVTTMSARHVIDRFRRFLVARVRTGRVETIFSRRGTVSTGRAHACDTKSTKTDRWRFARSSP